jgi:hypothetical protein
MLTLETAIVSISMNPENLARRTPRIWLGRAGRIENIEVCGKRRTVIDTGVTTNPEPEIDREIRLQVNEIFS